jgi:uncharacterized membrane-anchored protein
MKKIVRENLLFLLVATAAFFEAPAIVHANTGGTAPVPFAEPLSLSRGKLSPGSTEGSIVPKDVYCDFMLNHWGWASCDGVDGFVTYYRADIDTLVISAPNSDGYVKFDDWHSAERDDAIKEIRKELDAGLKAQGEQLGVEISFANWIVYPTLNEEGRYLYYAFNTSWDGNAVTNIKASLFDRKGYIEFMLVPVSEDPSEEDVKGIVAAIANGYTPVQAQNYAAFTSGDKVAAAGVVGVLASLMGVKYGKSILATITGIALLLAKKLWFVLFLPLLWLKKLFKKSE